MNVPLEAGLPDLCTIAIPWAQTAPVGKHLGDQNALSPEEAIADFFHPA